MSMLNSDQTGIGTESQDTADRHPGLLEDGSRQVTREFEANDASVARSFGLAVATSCVAFAYTSLSSRQHRHDLEGPTMALHHRRIREAVEAAQARRGALVKLLQCGEPQPLRKKMIVRVRIELFSMSNSPHRRNLKPDHARCRRDPAKKFLKVRVHQPSS